MVNQIDSIFSKVKKTAPKSNSINKPSNSTSSTRSKNTQPVSTPAKPKKAKREGTSSDPFSLQSKAKDNSMDFTEEGWKVYTPEELNIGKGGDTDLCPFDCNCCF